jgi:hypothetical protein
MALAMAKCCDQDGGMHVRTKKSPSVETGLNLFFKEE